MKASERCKRVGVLAIQGDFEAHTKALRRVGAKALPVLREDDLEDLHALIIPGGESTTISKGMERLGLYGPLRERIIDAIPVLGTCAGAILLARRVENRPVRTLEVLDVTAVRNAYGTQVDSFAATVDEGAAPDFEGLRCVFIRAPQLRVSGQGVEVLAQVDGSPVLVRQGNVMAATFHPELSDDPRVHRMLLDLS